MKTVGYLLDTNICVFLLRDKYLVKDKLRDKGIRNCYISEITVAELFYGAKCSKDVKKNTQDVKDFCASLKVIPIYESLEEYAKQKAKLRKTGTMIDDFDLLIGCTAIHHNMILVTDNLRHFERLPVNIENWVTRS